MQFLQKTSKNLGRFRAPELSGAHGRFSDQDLFDGPGPSVCIDALKLSNGFKISEVFKFSNAIIFSNPYKESKYFEIHIQWQVFPNDTVHWKSLVDVTVFSWVRSL